MSTAAKQPFVDEAARLGAVAKQAAEAATAAVEGGCVAHGVMVGFRCLCGWRCAAAFAACCLLQVAGRLMTHTFSSAHASCAWGAWCKCIMLCTGPYCLSKVLCGLCPVAAIEPLEDEDDGSMAEGTAPASVVRQQRVPLCLHSGGSSVCDCLSIALGSRISCACWPVLAGAPIKAGIAAVHCLHSTHPCSGPLTHHAHKRPIPRPHWYTIQPGFLLIAHLRPAGYRIWRQQWPQRRQWQPVPCPNPI